MATKQQNTWKALITADITGQTLNKSLYFVTTTSHHYHKFACLLIVSDLLNFRILKKLTLAEWWWQMSLIPSLRSQKQADLCELETSLVHKSEFLQSLQSHREILSQKNHRKKNHKPKTKTQVLNLLLSATMLSLSFRLSF